MENGVVRKCGNPCTVKNTPHGIEPAQKGARRPRFCFFFLLQARTLCWVPPWSQTPLTFFLSDPLSVPTLPLYLYYLFFFFNAIHYPWFFSPRKLFFLQLPVEELRIFWISEFGIVSCFSTTPLKLDLSPWRFNLQISQRRGMFFLLGYALSFAFGLFSEWVLFLLWFSVWNFQIIVYFYCKVFSQLLRMIVVQNVLFFVIHNGLSL